MNWIKITKISGALGTITGAYFYVNKRSVFASEKVDDSRQKLNESADAIDNSNSLQLKHVQVYFRHGARTPIHIIPALGEVTYDNKYILRDVPKTLIDFKVTELGTNKERPVAPIQREYEKKRKLKGGGTIGTLTGFGQEQMFELGKLLRQDYNSFLGTEFIADEILFQSTNIDRTIASLRCVLAGLYGRDELNLKGPINIPVGNDMEEVLFPNSHNCLVVRQIVHAAMIHFDDIPGLEKDRKFIESVLGIEASRGFRKLNFIHIRDDIAARQAHGYCVPPIIESHLDIIEKNAVKLMECAFSGQSDAERILALRLNVGLALGMTLNRMEDSAQRKSKQKMCLYSTHDSTLVALLASLDVFDQKWPPFAADLRFELYEDKNKKHWVKVIYCGKEQIVRGCLNSLVSYEEFIKNIKPMSIERKEYSQICKSNVLQKIAKGLLAHEAGEVENEEDKEDSDKPAGM